MARRTARDTQQATFNGQQQATDNFHTWEDSLSRNTQRKCDWQDATGSRSGTRRGGCSRRRWSMSSRRICLPVRNRPCPTCDSVALHNVQRATDNVCLPSCIMRHAPYNVHRPHQGAHAHSEWYGTAKPTLQRGRLALCNVQHATCNMQRATCIMPACNMQCATCSICGRSASCIIQHTTYPDT